MGAHRRVAVLMAALSIAAAACSSAATGSPAPPSAPPAATGSASAAPATPTAAPTADLTSEPKGPTPTPAPPTPTPAPVPTPTPAPTPVPTLPPVVHGQYLLYMTSIADTPESYIPQAWLVKPDGTGARKIAQGFSLGPYSPPPVDLDAVWSHDGSLIHITRWPSCAAHISNLPVGATTEIPVVTMTNRDWLFRWSPTGGKIAYWHYSGADHVCEQNSIDNIHDLAWMNASGGTKTIVKANVTYQLSAWLPDGSGLVAVNDFNAWYRVNLSNGSAVSLGVTASRLDVSPDGTKVAFLSGGKLYVRAFAGGVSKNLGSATDFAWRPDSAALAVSGGTLRKVNATTGLGAVVFAFATKSPTWSPDGSKLAFIKSSGGGVFVVPANGGPVMTIPGTIRATQVSWQP
jgi:hypothetical protein